MLFVKYNLNATVKKKRKEKKKGVRSLLKEHHFSKAEESMDNFLTSTSVKKFDLSNEVPGSSDSKSKIIDFPKSS